MAVSNAAFSSSFAASRSKLSDLGFPSLFHCSGSSRISFLRHASDGFGLGWKRSIYQASINSSSIIGSSSKDSDLNVDPIPLPIIVIDQDSDSDATIVQLSFGDRLGALIDTMKALRDLGLEVSKGTVTTEASVIQTKYFITRRCFSIVAMFSFGVCWHATRVGLSSE